MYGIFDGVSGSQGECEESAEETMEFGITLWPQSELPTDLASLWYIFEAGG